MAVFTKRLSAPSTTDRYWIHTSKGGLNECIILNSSTGSVLSNCVGYAWGRFYEIIGSRPKLSKANAENWYGNSADGYQRGQTPKLGAVICWRKGQAYNQSDGAGHVAIVEEIRSNGDIVTSNSNYKGTRFYTRVHTKSSNYYLGSSYTLQGFIYPPIEFTNNLDRVGTPVDKNTKVSQVEVLATSLRARKRPEMNDAVILGLINPGIYNVLETRDMTHETSNGYLWYKVAEDLWVASKEGDWTKFYEAIPEADTDAELEKLRKQLSEANTQLDKVQSALDSTKKELATTKENLADAQKELDIVKEESAEYVRILNQIRELSTLED